MLPAPADHTADHFRAGKGFPGCKDCIDAHLFLCERITGGIKSIPQLVLQFFIKQELGAMLGQLPSIIGKLIIKICHIQP